MKKTFSIQTVLKQGWHSFKDRYKFFLLISFFYVAVSAVPRIMDGIVEAAPRLAHDPVFFVLSTFIQIAAWVVSLIVPIGYTYILLRAVDNQSYELRDLFSTHKVFWSYIFTGIMAGVLVALGTILLVIPGIFLALSFMFVSYVVVDEHLSLNKALKRSYALATGVRWKLLGFVIVVGLLNIVGIALLGVGFLVTMPVSGLASMHLYKSLKHQGAELISKPEITPQETPVAA